MKHYQWNRQDITSYKNSRNYTQNSEYNVKYYNSNNVYSIWCIQGHICSLPTIYWIVGRLHIKLSIWPMAPCRDTAMFSIWTEGHGFSVRNWGNALRRDLSALLMRCSRDKWRRPGYRAVSWPNPGDAACNNSSRVGDKQSRGGLSGDTNRTRFGGGGGLCSSSTASASWFTAFPSSLSRSDPL